MKKILITLAFLSLSLVGFAQKDFTQATLHEILDEYKKDSHAFMNNHLSEDWRYINSKGAYQYQKEFLGGTAQSIVSTDILQPVIFQSGDLAITSGVHHTVLLDKEGKQYTRDVAATYTWQRRNGKWMFVASQQTPVAPSTFDEVTFNGMIARWGNDPSGFVQNECDKKFIFTDGNGKSYNYDQAVETYKTAFSKIDKKVEYVKVWQSGNTGLATGKTIETFQFKDGKAFTYTGLFTYTFSQSNGKWVLASAQHTDYKAPKTADK